MDIMSRSAIDGYSPPFDALDVLVLSQGDNVMSDGVSEYDLDKFGRVMGMHVGSFMACALKFKPMLSASGGTIVTLSSSASDPQSILEGKGLSDSVSSVVRRILTKKPK